MDSSLPMRLDRVCVGGEVGDTPGTEALGLQGQHFPSSTAVSSVRGGRTVAAALPHSSRSCGSKWGHVTMALLSSAPQLWNARHSGLGNT